VREHSLEGFEINDLLLGSHVKILAAAVQNRVGEIGEVGDAGDQRMNRRSSSLGWRACSLIVNATTLAAFATS
jgi:hypothetical protein